MLPLFLVRLCSYFVISRDLISFFLAPTSCFSEREATFLRARDKTVLGFVGV